MEQPFLAADLWLPALAANGSSLSRRIAREVASIKPSDAGSTLTIDFPRGGRLVVSHATLRFLIKIAYDVSNDQIVGGPAGISQV